MLPDAEFRELNRKLRKQFQGLFRLSWANDHTEWRRGKHQDTTPSGILIREWEGLKEVPKYVLYMNKYVLEVNVYKFGREVNAAQMKQLKDLKNFNGWEAVHCFQDKHGNYLKPVWKAMELVCYFITNPQKVFPSDLEYEERQERVKEYKRLLDIVEDATPAFHGNLKDGEAVFMDSTKQEKLNEQIST